MMTDQLVIGGKTFTSRLMVGTGKYKDFATMRDAIAASGAEIVTVSIRRVEIGCATVMPLASPIGSGRGILTRASIEIIIEEGTVPVVVDAGLGVPSEAASVMELGADAVLVNTALAEARDPARMAVAFRLAV